LHLADFSSPWSISVFNFYSKFYARLAKNSAISHLT
jgi:hypothetical protein